MARLNRNDKFIIVLMGLMFSSITVSGLIIRKYWAYDVITWACTVAIVIYIMATQDRFMANLFVFGLVGGFVELVTDWFHVEVLRTLVYDNVVFYLWASPGYMPFGWALLLVQYGYVAVRLNEILGTARTAAILILSGATMAPWYEELAWHTKHWHYQGSPAIGHTPYWVFLSYGLIMTAIAILTPRFRKLSQPAWMGLGVLIGVVIFCSGYVAHAVLG